MCSFQKIITLMKLSRLSFIEEPDISDAAASKIPNLRTD